MRHNGDVRGSDSLTASAVVGTGEIIAVPVPGAESGYGPLSPQPWLSTVFRKYSYVSISLSRYCGSSARAQFIVPRADEELRARHAVPLRFQAPNRSVGAQHAAPGLARNVSLFMKWSTKAAISTFRGACNHAVAAGAPSNSPTCGRPTYAARRRTFGPETVRSTSRIQGRTPAVETPGTPATRPGRRSL